MFCSPHRRCDAFNRRRWVWALTGNVNTSVPKSFPVSALPSQGHSLIDDHESKPRYSFSSGAKRSTNQRTMPSPKSTPA